MTEPSNNEPLEGETETPSELPEIENGFEDDAPVEPTPTDDDPALLDAAVRGFDADDTVAEPPGGAPAHPNPASLDDEISDTAAIDDGAFADAPARGATEVRLTPVQTLELSSHRIGLELKRVETQIRELLEDRDPKRKRKLSGTARWQELEEDMLALRYSCRIDEPTLAQVRQLIARRHALFTRLRFQATTRPTWNT